MVLSLLALTLCTSAQDYRAKITGRILDPSAAPVSKATVELKNTATSTTVTSISNEAGVFLFQFLDPGTYELSTTLAGFKKYVRSGITLQTGQNAGIDVRLEIGNAVESVTVTAEAAVLDTESASRGLTINTKLVQELPIRGRNPLNLANNLPGTTFRGSGIFAAAFHNGANVLFNVNGGSPAQNELLLDGAPNTARAANQQSNIALMPVNESVGEVSVITNAYDASYGRTSGGIINVSSRGGTAEHHAAVWGYLRRKPWSANAYPLNAIGQPRAEQNLNQYGFQVDGPILIPKLLKKSDRVSLFYLVSFEKFQELFPQPIRVTLPTAEMRAGDFSRLTNAGGDLIRIFDPFNPTLDATGRPTRTPFAGNRIPTSRIHPVAAAVSRYYQQPNDPGLPRQRYAAGNFSLPLFAYDLLFWNFNSRVDLKHGDNNRFFFRFARNRHDQNRTLNGILGSPGENGFNPFLRQNHALLADWVRIINPTTTLNIRANYARYVEGTDSQGTFNFDPSSLGLPSSLPGQLAVADYFGVWNVGGYSQLGSRRSIEYNNTYSILGSLSKVTGKHNLKIGVDVRRWQYLTSNLGDVFTVNTNAGFTREVWDNTASEVNSGDGYASFLLSAIASGTADVNARPFFRNWYLAPFIQDDWKVSQRLTLNLGLRWDLNTPPDEKHNRLVAGFDTEAASPIASKISAANLALYPELRNLRGGLRFAGVDGNRRTASELFYNTLQPRFGFAYSAASRMVVRGGFALFYANWPNGDFYQTQGFTANNPLVTSLDGNRTPIANLLSNPLPGGVRLPAGASAGLSTFAGNNFGWWNQSAQMPRVSQFSLGFQFRLTSQSSIDASYVGSRTANLMTSLASNAQSDAFIRTCDPSRGGDRAPCDQLVPNPFRGIAEFGATNLGVAATIPRSQLARPFPQFSGDLNQLGRADGRMWYNSFQTAFRQRMGANFVLDANYTFSKQISREGWLNTYAAIPQQSLVNFDRTHVFKASTHYELPFGRGKKFGGSAGRLANAIFGGWDLNAFYVASTGEPADLPGNAIMLRDPKVKVNRNQTIVRGWNPCVLQTGANGAVAPTRASTVINGCSATDFSNYAWLVPRTEFLTYRTNPLRSGQIRMPSSFTMDASVNKTVQITERLRFQFRAEAYNALNHFNVFSIRYNSNPLDANGNFGTYLPSDSGTSSPNMRDSPPRNIQLGLKLIW